MTEQQHTAIVTYGRGWPALTAVRSLGRRGVKVVCGDSVACSPSSFSRYCSASFRYPDHKQDPEGFLRALEQTIERHRPAQGELVLLPIHSETFLIAQHRERFERLGVKLAIPSHEQIEATHDKGRLAVLARELGITIPATRSYTDLADVYADAPRLSYPQFVKIRGAAAGVGVVKVDDPEELVHTYREMIEDYELAPADYPLVQGFVAGDDYCVTALFDRGRCLASFTYHNVRQFPRTTGAGVLREAVLAPAAEAEACRLLEHLEWHGLAQLDFRWGDDGQPHLIELNPRFFGGLPQAVASGVDYPWLVFQLALGQAVDTPVIDYAVRTETPVLGLLATASAIAHDPALKAVRPGSAAAYLREQFAKHKGTVNDVVRRDDPLPALGVLYPLAVLAEHGTLSTAVVLSEAQGKAKGLVKKGFRGHLQPSWATLLTTALLCLLAAGATSWAVCDGTLVEAFFQLPQRAATALVPAGLGSAGGLALFHVLQFSFLYALAAFGLKLREEVKAARLAQVAA